jgi:dTDP-4-dehydrorhamnose reductase
VVGVKHLADFAKENNIYFIQISTDYVFSDLGGKIGPFAETALPEQNIDNLCWYGHTKAIAENYIRNTLDKYAIVRTAYPYRVAFEQRLDFARTIIDLYKKNNLYPYFVDQQITPIFIDELCSHLIKILNNRSEGTFHLASSNLTTPFDFGSYIIEKVFGVKNVLKKGSLVEFLNADKNRPRKPIKGGLSTFKTTSELNISLMTWQEGVDRFVEGFLETENVTGI